MYLDEPGDAIAWMLAIDDLMQEAKRRREAEQRQG